MSRLPIINTEKFSSELRQRSIDLDGRRILVTNFHGTEQESDLTVPANCQGFGRVRHFRRQTSPGWPSNPLPIDPAGKALGLPSASILRSQVFQNAACNWRCWYCFVPFSLLSANSKHASMLSVSQMLDLYLAEDNRPLVIDITGGQPDLVPEWVPWMMQEISSRGLDRQIYLWSDDNLSNDYFWRFLTDVQINQVASYHNYGRVCCFKGFDDESFQFNTCADPSLFDNQFSLFRRLAVLGIDIYAYVTLTTPNAGDIAAKVRRFVDRLQSIHENLPLRTVPLEVKVFTPVQGRVHDVHEQSMRNHQEAIAVWNDELTRRFSTNIRSHPICDVPFGFTGQVFDGTASKERSSTVGSSLSCG